MTKTDICESDTERKHFETRRRDSPSRILACRCCGKRIEHRIGRRPRFCSDRCRNREIGFKRVRKASLGRDTRAPAKFQKKVKQFKALQRAKTEASRRIF